MFFRPVDAPSLPSRIGCVLIATEAEETARACARSCGLEPELVLDRFACSRRLTEARTAVRERKLTVAAIHTADWERQPLQPLYELAVLRLPVEQRFVLNGVTLRHLRPAQLVARALSLPVTAGLGGCAAFREATYCLKPTRPQAVALRGGDILAIWRGQPGVRAGGSVTHAAGMFGAFRALGFRVGLVTSCEPPPQVAANIDEVEVADPLPPSRRVTREFEHLGLNASLRAAARRMLTRVTPRFIYQRYAPFMTVGAWLSALTTAPLVVEWNSSEVWVRANWHNGHPITRPFDPLLTRIEQETMRAASLVRAVSTNAANMAVMMGAARERVKVITNGVDADAITRLVADSPAATTGARLGWIGSFGPWHGARILVESLAHMPAGVKAVMIGDGPERVACRDLAAKLSVADRIEWTGTLPHEVAVRTLSECDLLVSPHVADAHQRFFGSPTKLFEYMAIGRPIVASALEQIAEVLEDRRTARLVPPSDPAALAGAIIEVLALPDRGASLGQAAKECAQRQHTWDARSRALVDALDSVVACSR